MHIQLPAVHRSRRGREAEVALDEGAVVAAGAAQGDERLREVVPVQPWRWKISRYSLIFANINGNRNENNKA